MKRVITYGTYDLFHEGHYNMLKRAKEYGDYLIVGVTGENYDMERGKLSVKDSLAERIENVRKTGLADQIIVEEYLGQKINDIVKYGVDVLVIGDDWKGKFDHLSRYCELVYLERTKGISSTQIREDNYRNYRIGIITDYPDDNELIEESKKVTGVHVAGIYSKQQKNEDVLRRSFPNIKFHHSYEELIEQSDIVYVRTSEDGRTEDIRTALEKGRHVIYDPPASFGPQVLEDLYRCAKANNVVILSNVKMVHIHVFNQLLWIVQSGEIGEVLGMNCSISRINRNIGNLFYNLLFLALCPMIKMLGKDYKYSDYKITSNEEGIQFASLDFNYDTARAVINVGDKVRVRNQLEIVGTDGTIRIDQNWWRGSYFEIDKPGNDVKEVYSTNYQGNGFKYLIKAMTTMIENERLTSMGLFEDEAIKITQIIEEVKAQSGGEEE